MSDLNVCSPPLAKYVENAPLGQADPDPSNGIVLAEAHVGPRPADMQCNPVRALLRPCSVPGCPTLSANARCDAHDLEHQREVDARRGSSAERGYDATWRRLRLAKLAADPICQIRTHCLGLVATEVDHRIPIRQWPEGRLEWNNLQSTCKPCHAAKTRRESAQGIGVGGSFSQNFFPGDQRAGPFENPGNWKSAPEASLHADFPGDRTEGDTLKPNQTNRLRSASEQRPRPGMAREQTKMNEK